MKVSVIIPAYNEEDYIADTIKGVKELPGVKQIIVVDDGSNDRTAVEAEKTGAKVISHFKNMGKGEALSKGSKATDGDIIVFLDGDIGDSSKEVQKLINPILRGEADMTIAHFPPAGRKDGFGIAKVIATTGIYLLEGKRFNSPLSGQRAFSRRVLENLKGFASGYGAEVAMTLDVLDQGFRVMEVPVNMTHRGKGRNLKGFLHRGKQLVSILKVFLKKCIERRYI